MEYKRVLGIDPGSQMVGWAVAERNPGGPLTRVDSGVWKLGRAPLRMGLRLHRLHEHLVAVLERFQPDLVALEAAFLGKSVSSALRLGEARGVVLMTAESFTLPLVEYAPATVKVRVAGAGAATKEQVARLVCMHYDLHQFQAASSDEADALAVAACALMDPALKKETSLNISETEVSGARNSSKLPPGASFQ